MSFEKYGELFLKTESLAERVQAVLKKGGANLHINALKNPGLSYFVLEDLLNEKKKSILNC